MNSTGRALGGEGADCNSVAIAASRFDSCLSDQSRLGHE